MKDYSRKAYRLGWKASGYPEMIRATPARAFWNSITTQNPVFSEYGSGGEKLTSSERRYLQFLKQSEAKKPYLSGDYEEMEELWEGIPGLIDQNPHIDHPWMPDPTPTNIDDIIPSQTWVLYAFTEDEWCAGQTREIVVNGTHPIYDVRFQFPGSLQPGTTLEILSGLGTPTVTIKIKADPAETGIISMEAYEEAFDALPEPSTQGRGWTGFGVYEKFDCPGDKYLVYKVAVYRTPGGFRYWASFVWDIELERIADNIPDGSGGVVSFPCFDSELNYWRGISAVPPTLGSIYSKSLTVLPVGRDIPCGTLSGHDGFCTDSPPGTGADGCLDANFPCDTGWMNYSYDLRVAIGRGLFAGEKVDRQDRTIVNGGPACNNRDANHYRQDTNWNANFAWEIAYLATLVPWASAVQNYICHSIADGGGNWYNRENCSLSVSNVCGMSFHMQAAGGPYSASHSDLTIYSDFFGNTVYSNGTSGTESFTITWLRTNPFGPLVSGQSAHVLSATGYRIRAGSQDLYAAFTDGLKVSAVGEVANWGSREGDETLQYNDPGFSSDCDSWTVYPVWGDHSHAKGGVAKDPLYANIDPTTSLVTYSSLDDLLLECVEFYRAGLDDDEAIGTQLALGLEFREWTPI